MLYRFFLKLTQSHYAIRKRMILHRSKHIPFYLIQYIRVQEFTHLNKTKHFTELKLINSNIFPLIIFNKSFNI